ncbi:hypothetical protein THOM_0989, partial [Trachipleistophora hominis]
VRRVVLWFCNDEIKLNVLSLSFEEIVLHCHDSIIRNTDSVPDT